MNLEELYTDELEMRFDRAVVFQNLTAMDIGDMDEDGVRSLPAIRRLALLEETTPAVLRRLPAAQMLSLNVSFELGPVVDHDEEDGGEDEKPEMNEFASVISRMTNLKELSIRDLESNAPNAWKDPTQALRSMFEKLHQLEEISIHFMPCGFNLDSVMISLVQQNPNLRKVSLNFFDLTSAAFASLARLQHLSHINLPLGQLPFDVSTRPVQMMTDNVLTLLRGSSQNVICELRVWKTDVNLAQVTREIELMAEDRGTTFEKSNRGSCDFWKFMFDCRNTRL